MLDQKIEMLMKEAEVTGLAVSIFNQNEVVYQKAFGFADFESKDSLRKDHIFYGASLSKAVFGYVVARLVESGILDLDKPLQDHVEIPIPELPIGKSFRRLDDLKEDERYLDITPRMCLSHTTGLSNWRWINNPGERLIIHSDPGTVYSYSGEGIMLLQWIIEHLTEKPLEVLAREMVFDPLKMKDTDYLWQEKFNGRFCYGHSSDQQKLPKDIETEDAAAAGSMETTLVDYTNFLEHILELNAQDSSLTEILFKPNIRIRSKAQFGPLAKEMTNENDGIKLSYGLGWGLLETPHGFGAFKEGHSEGFQHYSILFPDSGIGILLMSNSDNAEGIFKELLEYSIADVYTPWKWEHYVPYQEKGESM